MAMDAFETGTFLLVKQTTLALDGERSVESWSMTTWMALLYCERFSAEQSGQLCAVVLRVL